MGYQININAEDLANLWNCTDGMNTILTGDIPSVAVLMMASAAM